MLSKQSQKLIEKKWPGIKDNKILLQNAKQELINYAYIFTVPPDAEEKFLARALRKTKSFRFAAIGFVILAILTFINEGRNIGPLAAYGGLIQFLVIAFGLLLFYKERMKLINCYKELLSEPQSEMINPKT